MADSVVFFVVRLLNYSCLPLQRIGAFILLMEEILHQLLVYPIIYRVLYIPGGAGSLPSTVAFMSPAILLTWQWPSQQGMTIDVSDRLFGGIRLPDPSGLCTFSTKIMGTWSTLINILISKWVREKKHQTSSGFFCGSESLLFVTWMDGWIIHQPVW